jgi:hypothetical protein
MGARELLERQPVKLSPDLLHGHRARARMDAIRQQDHEGIAIRIDEYRSSSESRVPECAR